MKIKFDKKIFWGVGLLISIVLVVSAFMYILSDDSYIENNTNNNTIVISQDNFIKEAREYKSKGDYEGMIKVYNDMIIAYPDEYVGFHNLAKALERAQKYNKANEIYIIILDRFASMGNQLILDIQKQMIENYLILKDGENARQYYVEYINKGGNRDEDLESRIGTLE